MKKIVIYSMFFFFLLLLPQMTAGVRIDQKPEEKSAINEWTILIGFITRPRLVNGDTYVTFQAIFVHYRTHWYGNIRTGFLRGLDTILLPRFHYGILANHFVCAKFNLALYP